jgi:hypothetical protein
VCWQQLAHLASGSSEDDGSDRQLTVAIIKYPDTQQVSCFQACMRTGMTTDRILTMVYYNRPDYRLLDIALTLGLLHHKVSAVFSEIVTSSPD